MTEDTITPEQELQNLLNNILQAPIQTGLDELAKKLDKKLAKLDASTTAIIAAWPHGLDETLVPLSEMLEPISSQLVNQGERVDKAQEKVFVYFQNLAEKLEAIAVSQDNAAGNIGDRLVTLQKDLENGLGDIQISMRSAIESSLKRDVKAATSKIEMALSGHQKRLDEQLADIISNHAAVEKIEAQRAEIVNRELKILRYTTFAMFVAVAMLTVVATHFILH